MSRRASLLSNAASFFVLVGVAVSVANATEERRAPRASDLRALGIRPGDFGAIGR